MTLEDTVERVLDKLEKISDYDQYVNILKQSFGPIVESGYPKTDGYDNHKYSVYYQFCAYQLIDEIIVKKQLKMPFYAQLYGLTVIPTLYHVLNVGLTREEWETKKQEILNGIDEIFGADSTSAIVTRIRNMVSVDISNKQTKVSSLAMYNYLYGFRVDFAFVNQPLTNLSTDFNYVLINATYNLDKEDAIIMYKNIPRMDTKLISKDMLSEYVPYTTYPVKPVKEPVHMVNNKAKQWKVGIDYNNGYGTVFTEVMDETERDRFLAGKLYESCSATLFDIEMRRRWTFKLNEEKETADIVETRVSKISGIVNELFSKDKYLTINRLTERLKEWLINDKELKYFSVYMENAVELQEWSVDFLANYIKDYFDFP
jgi:hypothetical protein